MHEIAKNDPFITEILDAAHGFPQIHLKVDLGSFNKILVKPESDEWFCPNSRKKVTLHSQTLPQSNGYWNLRGREFKVCFKKKLIATLLTEDCGLGSAKARAYVETKGFRIS